MLDRETSCAWPDCEDERYQHLAYWLVNLGEQNWNDLHEMCRASGRGANHTIDIYGDWLKRWEQLLQERNMPDLEYGLVAFTYCLCGDDSRRIIMTYEPISRILYPMWWDENHRVNPAGDRPAVFASAHVDHSSCLHSPDHFSAWA